MESEAGQLVRFFARIDSAQMECPSCGAVLRFGGRGRQAHYWDRFANRIKCPWCSRTYQLGLLAWPVRRNRRWGGIPADHLPDDRQRTHIRAEPRGVWMTEPRTQWSDVTNLTCTCHPGGSESAVPPRPRCPIHGQGGLSALVPDSSSLPSD